MFRKSYWAKEAAYNEVHPDKYADTSIRKRKRELSGQKMLKSIKPEKTRKSNQENSTPRGLNLVNFEKLKKPSRSKKPVAGRSQKARTSYYFYSLRHRPEVAKLFSASESSNIVRNEVRRRWNGLTKAEQAEFVLMAKKDALRIEVEKEALVNTESLVTPGEIRKEDDIRFFDCNSGKPTELSLKDIKDFALINNVKSTDESSEVCKDEKVNITLEEVVDLALPACLVVKEEENIEDSEEGLTSPERQLLALAKTLQE